MFGTSTFFPLPQKAELQAETTSEPDRSGQVVKAWSTIKIVNCLFMTNSGHKLKQIREEFEQTDSFYCDPSVNLLDGMRVVNIRDRKGNIVEPGPLYVQSVKRMIGFGGNIHHISCKLVGVTK